MQIIIHILRAILHRYNKFLLRVLLDSSPVFLYQGIMVIMPDIGRYFIQLARLQLLISQDSHYKDKHH